MFNSAVDNVIASVSNREWATLFWFATFLIGTAFYKPAREALHNVLKALFKPLLIIPLAIASLYAALEVYILYRLDIWAIANLKTTIIWLFSFAFVTMFEVVSAKERKSSLKKIAKEITAIAAILIFIAKFYSFSLIIEIITLPIITMIILIAEMAKARPEHAAVAKLFGWLSAVIGFWYFGFTIWYSFKTEFSDFTYAVALEFLLPIVLSLGFLPFLFFWLRYVVYNETFSMISIFGIDKKLVPYARWLAITRIRTDIDLLDRWRQAIQLNRPTNKTELKNSLIALLALREREESPPIIAPECGWSPYLAMQFLHDMSVETGYYHHSFDGEWVAQSPMREIGDGIGLRNNIAYYITGTETAATSLKIKLNINDPKIVEVAENTFTMQALHLLEQATGVDEVERYKHQIVSREIFEGRIPFGKVRLTYDGFTGISGGYARSFEIIHSATS